MKVPMATTNLFSQPVFKEGAFTANDPQVRRFAIQKTCASIDMGAELGAEVFVMWGGREGVEADAAKDIQVALERYKEAVDLSCEHIRERDDAHHEQAGEGDRTLPEVTQSGGHSVRSISVTL